MGLVVKLYDAVLEDLRRASDALVSGDVERRISSLNHALLIIAELESVLDHERGGDVARQLRGFYSVTRAMIVEANIRASRERIEKLTELFKPLRQAWQHVEEDVSGGRSTLGASAQFPALKPNPSAASPQREAVGVRADIGEGRPHWSA